MDYINAFWVGGLICALVQILMEKTKMLPGRIMVLLVCLGRCLAHCRFISHSWSSQEPVQVCHCLALEIHSGKA